MANLRVRNDFEIAATTKEIAALDTRIRQLRDPSSGVDADTLTLEQQCNRAVSRLADSQRRFNDLARQFSELELTTAPDQAADRRSRTAVQPVRGCQKRGLVRRVAGRLIRLPALPE
jgi:hypothetical protein